MDLEKEKMRAKRSSFYNLNTMAEQTPLGGWQSQRFSFGYFKIFCTFQILYAAIILLFEGEKVLKECV